MAVLFEKRLTPSEKERHWIIVPSSSRKYFPSFNVVFKIRVGREMNETYIDNYSRLRLGSGIFNKLELDELNACVVVERNSEGTYTIKRNKVKA